MILYSRIKIYIMKKVNPFKSAAEAILAHIILYSIGQALSDLFALKAEPVPEVMTVTLDILIKAPISTSAGEDYSALWYVVISVQVFTPEQSALDSVGVGLNEVIIVVSNEKALDNVCCVVHNSQHIAQTNSTPPLGGP